VIARLDRRWTVHTGPSAPWHLMASTRPRAPSPARVTVGNS
jgi:hypothetical protein